MDVSTPDLVDDLPPPQKRAKKSKKTKPEDETVQPALADVPAEAPASTEAENASVEEEPARIEAPTRRAADLLKLQLKKREDKKEARKAQKITKRVLDVESGLVEKPKRVRTKAAVQKLSYDSVLPSHKAWSKATAKLLRKKATTEESEALAFLTLACPAGIPEDMPSSGSDLVAQSTLVGAQLVGCSLTVIESKTNPSLLNKSGIVLQETLATFKVVTPESVVRFLPKKDTVFTFVLPLDPETGKISKTAVESTSFVLYGNALVFRSSSDGTVIKWKPGSGPGGEALV